MEVEERLAALEARLRKAEDQLEIFRLLNSYGPLVDSGSGGQAAKLWTAGGGYSFSEGSRLEVPHDLVALYESDGQRGLVSTGVARVTASTRVTVNGDRAQAVGYSFVIVRDGESWQMWRAAINEWTLVRTGSGWRIEERLSRALDGSAASHEVMRRVLA